MMLRPYWMQGAAGVPQVGPGMPDPDRQIVEALGMSPVSSGLRVRSVKGATYCMAENGFLETDDPVDLGSREWQGYLSTVVLLALQWSFRPYLADCRYEPDAAPLWLPPVSGQADARRADGRGRGVPASTCTIAPIHDIQVEAGSSAGPATLLNILARHATLQEYGVQAITLPPPSATGPLRALEGELLGIVAEQSVAAAPAGPAPAPAPGPHGTGGASVMLATGRGVRRRPDVHPAAGHRRNDARHPIAGVTGTLTAGEFIAQQIAIDPLPFARLAEFLAAIDDLAGVDADQPGAPPRLDARHRVSPLRRVGDVGRHSPPGDAAVAQGDRYVHRRVRLGRAA